MGRVIIVLLILAAASLAMKVIAAAIVLLFFAALIFRTKETLGLMMLGGIIAGFQSHPLITTGIVAIVVALAIYAKKKERQASEGDGQTLLPGPDD